MTTGYLHLDLIILGVLGQVIFLFAMKVPKARLRATTANEKFVLKDYLKAESEALISAAAAILIGVFCVDQFVAWKPEYEPFLKIIAVMYGALGTSILTAAIGKFDKKILDVVDEKTNFADKVQAERDKDSK